MQRSLLTSGRGLAHKPQSGALVQIASQMALAMQANDSFEKGRG